APVNPGKQARAARRGGALDAEEIGMAEKDSAESGRRLHVTTLLVASRRALDNALAELGFAEDDDRVVEHDGRLAFLTCSHEEDCDDMFALITELSARGESWELQSRIDAEAGRAIYQSFARYRPVEAVDAAVEEEQEPETSETPVHDIETAEGLQALKRILKRIEPAGAFATIRPGRGGRGTARLLRRGARRGPPPQSPGAAAGLRAGFPGGERRRRIDPAQRDPRDPAQRHARRRDEAARVASPDRVAPAAVPPAVGTDRARPRSDGAARGHRAQRVRQDRVHH